MIKLSTGEIQVFISGEYRMFDNENEYDMFIKQQLKEKTDPAAIINNLTNEIRTLRQTIAELNRNKAGDALKQIRLNSLLERSEKTNELINVELSKKDAVINNLVKANKELIKKTLLAGGFERVDTSPIEIVIKEGQRNENLHFK